jgi:outer membrane protein OmpA-like peptidoglycan-associated protein
LTSWYVLAQETVIWAAEVVDVSSEFSPYEYSAIQVLHRPNAKDGGGPSPNAWRPKRTDKEEFIVVSFDTPIKAQQVAVVESENPGAIKAIYGYDKDYNEFLLVEATPRDLPIDFRLYNYFFPETTYEIQAIKVVLDCSINSDYNAIDAIGISTSNIPINVLVNLLPKVNNELEPEKLGENVNSSGVEHSPLVSPDGKRMYFSRQFHPDNVGGEDDPEDIWYSDLDEETGEWLPAVNAGPPLNTEGPNFISSINMVDGKEVFILGNVYGKKGRMYTGVSTATREGDSFSDPVEIDIEDDYNYSPSADFFLVPGGEAMIMSVERDDTYGYRDLYVSFKKSNGQWSVPKNLGPDVNTVGIEKAPFLAEDGKTLYFSSDGWKGYGGQDIYVTFRLEEDNWFKWSEPENLGAGVNREGDDEYLSIPPSGTNLYFTRGSDDENKDIFTFKADDLFVEDAVIAESPLVASIGHLQEEKPVQPSEPVSADPIPTEPAEILITVQGRIINAKNNKPVQNANVQIERLPDGLDVGEVQTDNTGSFRFTVRGGARYSMVGNAEGFISQSENFDFNDSKESQTIKKNILIKPIEKGETIVLNSIFFDFDKYVLKTSSYPELNRVLDFMKDDKIKKIALYGHTDSIGDEDYNMLLSGRRAKSVMEFLTSNGIASSRVSYEAFGETKPVESNETREGRSKNRRVEFEIIE